MPLDNYYTALGLNKNSTCNKDDIKKAYKKAAFKWHPDKWASKNEKELEYAESEFKKITQAYEILKDPEKKELYDNFGENGLNNFSNNTRQHMNPNMFNRNVFFNQGSYFNDSSPFYTHNMCRQENIPTIKTSIIQCSLEELYKGIVRKIRVRNCIQSSTSGLSEILELDIRPGWKENTTITFNRINCKFIFIIKEKPHTFFKRDGDNLIWLCTLTNKQLSKNINVTIPLLDGEAFTLSTQDDFLYNGLQKVIYNKGMPIKNTSKFGNLIINFSIT